MSDEKKTKKRPPRGIRLRPNGMFRLYVTRDGRPYQPLVTWELLGELNVTVPATTRQTVPGLELAQKALSALQTRVMKEQRTGVIASTAKTKVAELYALVEDEYTQLKRKSLRDVRHRWRNHLQPAVGNLTASQVTTERINDYIRKRQLDNATNATVNRELSILSHAFRLGLRSSPAMVQVVPYIKKLPEAPPRQGFLADAAYDALARECSAEGLWLRAMLAVGSSFAWRKSEVLNLRVRQLDFPGRLIRLDIGATKNGSGRAVRMSNEVFELLSACAANKTPNDFLFTRDGAAGGERIRDFRGAWRNACERAGCPSLLFHDLRRTGARNLRRLHVSEGVIMKIGGWKTRAVFERYNIVDETDLADAASRLDEKRAAMDAKSKGETATKTETEAGTTETRKQAVQ